MKTIDSSKPQAAVITETSKEMVGRDIDFAFADMRVSGKITYINRGAPRTSFGVQWLRVNNPNYPFRDGAKGYDSIIHVGQIIAFNPPSQT